MFQLREKSIVELNTTTFAIKITLNTNMDIDKTFRNGVYTKDRSASLNSTKKLYLSTFLGHRLIKL